MSRIGIGISLLAILSATAVSPAAMAEDAKADGGTKAASDGKALDVIVVTANRRGASKLQSTPMAITAISAQQLNKLNLTSLSDYANQAPSVYVQEQGPGVNNIVIRGLSTRGLVVSEVEDRSLVSVYVDDMPVTMKSGNPDLKILDLVDVEVLRGPQGTLYGAGSMAGTIRQTTVKPNLQAGQGYVEATGSQTSGSGAGNGSLRGMLNVPLIDGKLALRLNAYNGSDARYINNLGTGNKHANSYKVEQGRAALRFQPTDKLTIDASLIYARSHGGLNDAYTGLGDYTYTSLATEASKDNMRLYNLAFNYDFGFANLISSSSYVNRQTYYLQDQGILESNWLFGDAYPVQKDEYTIRNSVNDFVEEVRLVSKDKGDFNWTTGAFFERGTRHFWQDEPYGNFDALYSDYYGTTYHSKTDDFAFNDNDIFSGRQKTVDRQLALFAEGNYSFLEKFKATAGLRYFDWKQAYDLFFSGYYGNVGGQPTTTHSSAAAHGINPRFVLDYHATKDVMFYAEAAKGFRYGGNNQPIPQPLCTASLQNIGLTSAPATFGPDSLWSYTVAEKGTFLNGRLNFNVTGFKVDWNQTQTATVLDCSYYFTQNIGRVESKGIEFETRFKLTPRLTMGVNASYTDSQTAEAVPSLHIAAGQRAPYAPRYIANASLDYTRPWASGTFNLSGSWAYKSYSTNMFDQSSDLFRRIPASDNLSLAASYYWDRYEISLYGNNLTNGTKIVDYDRYPTSPDASLGDRVYLARPRTIGIRLKASY